MVLFSLAVVSTTPTIDVIVLGRHRPQAIAVNGRCRHRKRPVDTVAIEGRSLSICTPQRRCRRFERATVVCDDDADLTVLRPRRVAARRYGRRLRVTVRDNALRIVARLPMDAYLAGVLDAEMAQGPSAARRAQAVVARTYARVAQATPRHHDAPVCDLTHCQVFAGRGRAQTRVLVRETPGYLIDANGAVRPVFFHSTCGGRTLEARAVWPSAASPHLVGVDDTQPTGQPWCHASPHFVWVTDIGQAQLADALGSFVARPWHAPSLHLAPRDADGREWTIADRAQQQTVRGARVHHVLGRRLGWSTVKSGRFEATRVGDSFRLEGRGLGHRVGLCQTGAVARAKAGQSTEAILQAYFPRLRWTR